MGTLCGWASIDENGKATGGQKGDQTGREVKTGNWYDFGQTVVLRFKDRNKAAKAATAMKQLCANDNVGYCQGHRTSLYTELEKVGWNPTALKTPCETDCSAMMGQPVLNAQESACQRIFTQATWSMLLWRQESLKNSPGSKYTGTGDNLMTGDISVAQANTRSWHLKTAATRQAATDQEADQAIIQLYHTEQQRQRHSLDM